MEQQRFRFLFRVLQISIALIPLLMGLFAFLNGLDIFKLSVQTVVDPLITLQGDHAQSWRALPANVAPYIYTLMFIGEGVVGLLALCGVISMLLHIGKPSEQFEQSKQWVYLACVWGTLVWGLGFFEIGGDWFLAWTSNNAVISGLQQGALMYVLLLWVVFFYLKQLTEK
ncbi:MAG TPA: DUF2165 family protein [Coxiellaceae bacterium]|nr:DUF2165 family protein [Coxiellaceae bacterium]